MSDIIHLLPDAIANQIAAGEVIQRPASVVKELLENSVDAGSSEIKLIIKDSGKTLIQVVDNGSGMTVMDARMCFERHATSKIRSAADLFSVQTKGFRGEALASISAIAQVELKTKQATDELGIKIVVEGSSLKTEEPCSCTTGTSFSVRNLFYNVPARRKFLKSDPVELKHILDEFIKVVIAHPEIFFSCFHNDYSLYHLNPGNTRQRIVSVFGKVTKEKLIPVFEETDFIKIEGFVCKPEFSKKSRSEQYFFINQRFIKSNYFAHAVKGAYEAVIPERHFPIFFLFIHIDPSKVDINVHPTKQEVKFEEERLIYNYIKVSVKHALGQYSLTPTIDFDQLTDFTSINHGTNKPSKPSRENDYYIQTNKLTKNEIEQWERIYSKLRSEVSQNVESGSLTLSSDWEDEVGGQPIKQAVAKSPFQLHGQFIICQIKSGLMIIDQQAAHERILYERILKAMQAKEKFSQQELFPSTFQLEASKSETFKNLIEKVNQLGFVIEEFGHHSYIVRGIPTNLKKGMDVSSIIDEFIEQYTSNLEFQLGLDENVARSMAYSTSIRRGKFLDVKEMESLIDQLFACETPYKSPSGKKCFISEGLDEIQKRFIE